MKTPLTRALKKQMRRIDDSLHSIWLTYGERGIERDPEVRVMVQKLLTQHENLTIALREAKSVASPVS